MYPEYEYYWIDKGKCLEKLGRYDEALEYYDEIIRLYPSNGYPWYEKGRCLSELERYEEALEYFDKALEWTNMEEFIDGKNLCLEKLGGNTVPRLKDDGGDYERVGQ